MAEFCMSVIYTKRAWPATYQGEVLKSLTASIHMHFKGLRIRIYEDGGCVGNTGDSVLGTCHVDSKAHFLLLLARPGIFQQVRGMLAPPGGSKQQLFHALSNIVSAQPCSHSKP